MLASYFGVTGQSDQPPQESAEAQTHVIDELMAFGREVKRPKAISAEEWLNRYG